MGSLTGRVAAQPEIVQGVFLAIGFAALSDIHADFVRKARGDVGEDGNKWPRLSPKYLAYGRRFGPGEQSRLKAAAGLGRANSKAPGLLTASQLKRWRQIYGTRLARFAASMPLAQAKAKAAAIAWATLKAEGAKTKLEVYGNRQVEVLRDTGILLNSLSMGKWAASCGHRDIQPSAITGREHQVFSVIENGVIVGTNVPYAASHNFGDPKRGIPARPFIPHPDRVPTVWLQRWLRTGMTAVSHAMRYALQHGRV